MSVERLALGCLLPSFPGHEAPDWVLRRLEGGLGGVTLFADNVRDQTQLAALTARLRSAGEILVALDEEGGDVTRLEAARGSSYPGNLALGAVDDVELTAGVAAAIAADLARVGVNMNLAPVADVNVNPRNPVIGCAASAPSRSSSPATSPPSSRGRRRRGSSPARSTSLVTATRKWTRTATCPS